MCHSEGGCDAVESTQAEKRVLPAEETKNEGNIQRCCPRFFLTGYMDESARYSLRYFWTKADSDLRRYPSTSSTRIIGSNGQTGCLTRMPASVSS